MMKYGDFLFLVQCLDEHAAKIHDLQVLRTALLHPEATFAELIANDALLLVGQVLVVDHIIGELFKQLCDAVCLETDIIDIFLQFAVVTFAANRQKIIQIYARNDARHFENILFGDSLIASLQTIARLQCGDGPTHVAIGDLNDSLVHTISDIDTLLAADELQSFNNFFGGQGLETELCATRSDRFNDARDVVAHQTETGCSRFFFHGSTKGCLGCVSHGIGLVEDDNFEGRTTFATG